MRLIPGPTSITERACGLARSVLASCIAVLASVASPGFAASNIEPEHAAAWGANIGWTNWRPDPSNGAEVGEFVCAGFVYGANIGWIHLGDGTPENGIYYQNNSATDYGVNRDPMGKLRGFAYGANVGWIEFGETGSPRVDLLTGKLSGSIYGANIGWISLDAGGFFLKIHSLTAGSDTDGDGIPDGWELSQAGNLGALENAGDADQDGMSDRAEYLADTDPLDPSDQLRVLEFSQSGEAWLLTWPSKLTRQYVIQSRAAFDSDNNWIDAAAGLQTGTGGLLNGLVAPDPAAPHSFFRIKVVMPLREAVQGF